MGYDFKPRNKIEPFHLGAFSWPWMLGAGPGIIFGFREGIEPASYIAEGYEDKHILDNSGFYVYASDAKLLAKLLRKLVTSERFRWGQYRGLAEDERKRIDNDTHRLYKGPVREDWLDKAEAFADWAEKSGGFWIR